MSTQGKPVNPVVASIVVIVVIVIIVGIGVWKLGGGYHKTLNAPGTDEVKAQFQRTGHMPGTMLPGMMNNGRR